MIMEALTAPFDAYLSYASRIVRLTTIAFLGPLALKVDKLVTHCVTNEVRPFHTQVPTGAIVSPGHDRAIIPDCSEDAI